jgi:hypothetical protein
MPNKSVSPLAFGKNDGSKYNNKDWNGRAAHKKKKNFSGPICP